MFMKPCHMRYSKSLPQCSVFLLQREGLLAACNSAGAGYLFMKDKVAYDASFDMGDKTIMCGRLSDALKFWLMWKAKVRPLPTAARICDSFNFLLLCCVKQMADAHL